MPFLSQTEQNWDCTERPFSFICPKWIFVSLFRRCNSCNKHWGISGSDLQHRAGPEKVTQYAGGQGTLFSFFKEMIEFSIIKTDGGKSSPDTCLLFEPASMASLFTGEWLRCCWQQGALAPDGLIKLASETLLNSPCETPLHQGTKQLQSSAAAFVCHCMCPGGYRHSVCSSGAYTTVYVWLCHR